MEQRSVQSLHSEYCMHVCPPARLGLTLLCWTGRSQSSAAATVPACVVKPMLTTLLGSSAAKRSRMSWPMFTSPLFLPMSVALASPRCELCAPACRHVFRDQTTKAGPRGIFHLHHLLIPRSTTRGLDVSLCDCDVAGFMATNRLQCPASQESSP